MSGPIVRKYGFPNFDKIFGERPLQHGVDEAAEPLEPKSGEGESKPKKKGPAKSQSSKTKKS